MYVGVQPQCVTVRRMEQHVILNAIFKTKLPVANFHRIERPESEDDPMTKVRNAISYTSSAALNILGTLSYFLAHFPHFEKIKSVMFVFYRP
jgi:hypothetical protein